MVVEDAKPAFVPGLELAEGFYREAVRPILDTYVSDVEYSAALIGSGSEVLGYDDGMSTDHHWGPRVMLFFSPPVLEARGQEISDLLGANLPYTFRGHSTNWTEPGPNDNGTQGLCGVTDGPINHRVEMWTVNDFFGDYLGVEIAKPLRATDWLTLPCQKLRSIGAGRLFHDDLDLAAIRDRFSWYPHDVWLYILASCWSRIGQDEHLMGRAGLVGDEIGSSVIASRLVRDIMRLAFLMERTYPPYAKWLGTAFAELKCAGNLQPVLGDVIRASSWKERDIGLAMAYRRLAEMHNTLGITPALPVEPSPFWGRPFTVIHGDRFAEALRDAIRDETVKAIARRRLIGNVDLISDNTDLLEDPARCRAVLTLYE